MKFRLKSFLKNETQKRLGLLGFMNHYNVETDSTVGGNYGLHDQAGSSNIDSILAFLLVHIIYQERDLVIIDLKPLLS